MRQVANKSDLVFAEIFNAIGVLGEKISSSKFVYSSAKLSEARRQIVELESLLQREKAEVEVGHSTYNTCNTSWREYFLRFYEIIPVFIMYRNRGLCCMLAMLFSRLLLHNR